MRAVTNIVYCAQGFVRFSAVELECQVWMGIREEMKQEIRMLPDLTEVRRGWRRTPYGFLKGQQIRK